MSLVQDIGVAERVSNQVAVSRFIF